MQLFIVEKCGIQSSSVAGIYDNQELAIKAAKKLKKGERDDYHEYVVTPYKLNVTVKQTKVIEHSNVEFPVKSGGNLVLPTSVYII